ncbi:MAG: 50S ribosomal protein L6 [Caulobacteraceae bacterium]
MSRIGKKAVSIPSGVTVTLEGQTVTVKGPKGQLAWTVSDEIEVKQEGAEVTFAPRNDTQRARGMWGLSRTLIGNMVEGVTKGYEETLELVGVGYRAAMKGQALSMQLGFSHDVDIPPPAGITFAVPKQTEVRVSGIDKQLVGEVAARIRRIRPPEPYKGKGVRYAGEKVRRKEGKKK